MITDFKELVNLCRNELIEREYTKNLYNKINHEWDKLGQWVIEHGYSNFNEDIRTTMVPGTKLSVCGIELCI